MQDSPIAAGEARDATGCGMQNCLQPALYMHTTVLQRKDSNYQFPYMRAQLHVVLYCFAMVLMDPRHPVSAKAM